MRPVLVLLAVVVVALIIGVGTNFINLSGQSGSLPKVAVEGGKMPSVNADVGSIDVGQKKTTVDVPTVGTRKEDVSVPTLSVKKAGE